MKTGRRRAVSTHYYRPDDMPPPDDRCREPGLNGGVCGLPRRNQHHQVPDLPDGLIAAERRRIGERDEDQ